MKQFAALFDLLDATTKTTEKVDAIKDYLDKCSEEDKLLSIAVLSGNKPKRPFKTTQLREWAANYSGVPLWLFEESYYIVGDLGETITHLVEPIALAKIRAQSAVSRETTAMDISGNVYPQAVQPLEDEVALSLRDVFVWVLEIAKKPLLVQQHLLFEKWDELAGTSLFLFNKMLTSSLRVGVSRKLVIKAIAKHLDRSEQDMAHLMMGKWDPLKQRFDELFTESSESIAKHIPYPFCLAYPIDVELETLGSLDEWIFEKKLDGIRGQIIVREGELFIWSRGEDLLTDKFPEFADLVGILPNGTVIDGEILPIKDGEILNFATMQTRIGRKNLSANILREVPLMMVCYDLLELEGQDLRQRPMSERRALLEELLHKTPEGERLLFSENMHFQSWEEVDRFRRSAREYHCEGLMLKGINSTYEVGRKKGVWWKFKAEPLNIDGVLIYAQSGSGRRANLFTDYTFAVWDGDLLVPFTKAYSGLTDKEIARLDKWVKANTKEKFGPVRSVTPYHVFELGFEGINKSTRHKSGVALRFPRIIRWREDKQAADANTLSDLLDLLKKYES